MGNSYPRKKHDLYPQAIDMEELSAPHTVLDICQTKGSYDQHDNVCKWVAFDNACFQRI